MKLRRRQPPPPPLRRTRALVEALETPFLLRPDGVYWRAPDGHQEFGPFATVEAARIDMNTGTQELQADESLAQVEEQIGLATWLDPETGEPAEGGSPPHLEEP